MASPPLPHQQLPWLMLTFDEHNDYRSFFSLTDGKTHTLSLPNTRHNRIVGSVDGWLVLVNLNTVVHLLDPINRAIVHLPPLTTMSQFIIPREEAEGEYEGDDEDGDEFVIESEYGRYTQSSYHLRDLFLNKLILSADGTAVASITRLKRVAFARAGDDKWAVAETSFLCTDMLCFDGQLYAVDKKGVVARCEAGPPPTVTPITSPTNKRAVCWYLVESAGELLLVARYRRESWEPFPYAYPTEKFQVFRLDRLDKEAELVEVKSLGDRVLFLGTNRSMSIDAKDHPGCRGNRIYFTSSSTDIFYDGNHGTGDFGVFDMEDGSIESLPCYPDNSKVIWPPPIWFTPSRN